MKKVKALTNYVMKRSPHIFKLLVALIIVMVGVIISSPVQAQSSTPDNFGLQPVAANINVSTQTTDLRVVIVRIINIFLGFLGVVAVLIVLYGGYLYMTSGGDEEQIGTAKKLLINGVIGLVIILSSFAITSFIFSRLQDAINGDGDPGDPGIEGSCSEPGTPYYNLYNGTSVCDGFCSLNSNQCTFAKYFVVKSITPHTPGANDTIDMNNTVIRVLFSKKVAGNVTDVFKIYKKETGEDITSKFVFVFEEDGTLVSARYTEGDVCATIQGVDMKCIPNGEYEIKVNKDVKDISGKSLTTEVNQQTFPLQAVFKTGDAPVIDRVFDVLDPISINGQSGNAIYTVVQGSPSTTIETTLRDDKGNSYAQLRIFKEGATSTILNEYVDGPLILQGSSAVYQFKYGARITFASGKVYVAEVTAHDIDGNTTTTRVRFRTIPPTCRNGVLDSGETNIDEGGPCGGSEGNSCTEDSDCSPSLKCMDNRCTAVPYISKVEPMDGAPGNWITILGKHFGATPGVVKFNYDLNGDGAIDSSSVASLAQCRVGSMWNDSWIITEVPARLGGSTILPNISVTDVGGHSDASNDNFGPNLGLFTYNDTKRPNLCSVTVAADRTITLDDGTVTVIHAGDRSAPQGTSVAIEGKAFGTSNGVITFGSSAANVTSWSQELINSTVPFGGEGITSVYVTADNNEKSNPVPFTISSLSNLYPPTITSIDPPTTTKGSYITISGTRFGASGNVYFTAIEGNSCPGAGCVLAARLPDSCGDVWSDTQIIAKVPVDQEFVLGKYFVTVQRNDGVNTLHSSGKESVDVVIGDPRPSICRIDPRRGFAPLSGSTTLTLYGENFSTTNPQVKFWFPLGNSTNPDSWLSASLGDPVGGASIVRPGSQEIETTIPYDTNSGLSMSSGPVKVKNGAVLFSNGVNYDVLDCREPSSPQLPGFQCCSEGPDAGRWKQGNFACAGTTREAGYVWRFTTGKMPQKFLVVESCSATELPTPSPSTLWDSGKNECINPQLQARFNLPVDQNTVLDQDGDLKNILVATCGGSGTEINCSQNTSLVTGEFAGVVVGSDTLVLNRKSNTNLTSNTWYRVAILPGVSSLRTDTELGVSITRSEKIESTRPCDINGVKAAYCFDFRTADFMCTLVGAGMHPPLYTTHILGVVQDPRSRPVFDISQVFNVSNLKPLEYFVYGKSNLACTSINVDTKPWEWGPSQPAPATAKHLDQHPNSYGYATAWQHNPLGSEIAAKITEGTETIVANSTLIIDLGNPYAKNVWPSCIEACVNAEIGIEFSQLMNVGDYSDTNIKLYKCADENCTGATSGSSIGLTIAATSQSDTIFRAYPQSPLKKDTWYLVDMGSGIRSIGGVVSVGPPPVVKLGTSATSKQWKFKTKNSDQLCLADSVHVQPDPFYSTFIGQAQLYKALPVGSPDSCSPQGQQLNPWNFGWNWSVEDEEDEAVATVSNFSFGGSPKSTCTIGCTPAGSDISKAQNTEYVADHPNASSYPVCGNARKDSGEDCDIAAPGEVPGTSCTFSCLRPGNIDTNTCGNSVVDTRLGEECDPKDPNGLPGFCTDTCVNKGSSVEQTGDPKIPVCGSGTATDHGVTYGEDCDTADPTTKDGCSNRCLNLGTLLSQDWCDDQTNNSEFSQVCQTATSVCGNGTIEQGEECDETSVYCSDRCLVQNACAAGGSVQGNGTPWKQCEADEEGCLSDCTLAGSSITYSSPSVCGDGSVKDSPKSIGEFYGTGAGDVHSCEVAPGQSLNQLGENPVQVVTSVGGTKAGQSVALVTDMETKINAGTATAQSPETGKPTSITEVTGSGEYHLQCGYTEYAVPQSGSYNNCPINSENKFGAGLNSCCTERPQRISNYPAPNAGIGNSAPICRNTYIEVVFDQNIPLQYLQNNITLVQSTSTPDSCATLGGKNVTLEMRALLAVGDTPHHNFFVRIWDTVKNFFVRLIRVSVFAADTPLPTNFKLSQIPSSQNLFWCTSAAPLEISAAYQTSIVNPSQIVQTIVSVYPSEALQSNQYVVVQLNGGKDGINNATGVSIRSPFGPELSDYWVFKTSDQICKINEVTVEPVSSLFTSKTDSKDFIARAISKNQNTNQEQLIVPIHDQYEWVWNWGPQGNAVFDIPSIDSPNNKIKPKGVRGHTDGIVEASIKKDLFEPNNQNGKSFSATFTLDALFCQRPWPASGVDLSDNVASTAAVFEDLKYHFSMYYCADSGTTSALDDLPYFRNIEVITNPQELGLISGSDLPQALRRYLMFADKTDDAIGVQIFANPVKIDGSRQTLEEWYTDKFGDIGAVKKASVAGYSALTNEFNVYINTFNLEGDSIYNNIYLFSIDTNATVETKMVFQQLINSLRFNTNLTNYEKCLKEDIDPLHPYTVRDTPGEFNSALSCTTDFDCRDELSGKPKVGTNGVCSNAATKFNRDIIRLEQMHATEDRTDSHLD